MISEAGPVDEGARSLVDRLASSKEILVVGVLDGELHEMFGQIQDLAADSEGNLYVLDATDAHLHSFGSGYQFGGPMAREDLSRGSLTCSRHTDDVVFTFRYLPVMRGHSSQGEIKWTSSLSDFNPMHITEDTNTHTLTYSGNEGVSDVVYHLTIIDETGYTLVQVLSRTPESIQARREYAEILTYVVDLETGGWRLRRK